MTDTSDDYIYDEATGEWRPGSEMAAQAAADAVVSRDASGALLANGDSVVLIKDLKVKFSSADEYIFMTAKSKAGPGNSTIWRAINTTHHITRVIKDMGKVLGRRFTEKAVQPLAVQNLLFP